jgi:hypothetical protein
MKLSTMALTVLTALTALTTNVNAQSQTHSTYEKFKLQDNKVCYSVIRNYSKVSAYKSNCSTNKIIGKALPLQFSKVETVKGQSKVHDIILDVNNQKAMYIQLLEYSASDFDFNEVSIIPNKG